METLNYTFIPQAVILPPIQQISCGIDFSVCLTDDGYVYSFGDNSVGQLGLEMIKHSNSPCLIASMDDIQFVECGGSHTFCKSSSGKIYCWGNNLRGQLGIGIRNIQKFPVQCESFPNNVVDIKCGSNHSLLLTSNRDVYSCGYNDCGQLGGNHHDKNSVCSLEFQKIKNISEITRIECGTNFSICIDMCENMFVFGHNYFGQLGLPLCSNTSTPIKHSLSNIIDISSGGFHTFVKTSLNEIYAFGYNRYSQLGIKTEDDENQLSPVRVFEDYEDIWCSNINKSKAKSARF